MKRRVCSYDMFAVPDPSFVLKDRVSVDVYSFTDRELAAELVRLARSGVRVRVYRDSRESMQENQRGSSTTPTLLAGGVEVRVKASQDLMHFKSYVIDGALLVQGPRLER